MPNPNLPINFRKNTYIGARYVPKFADTPGSEWDNSIQYEPLTIVLYQGNSYTSKTFVPVGVDINNGTYWANTGNYNAQVEVYRQEVEALKEDVETNATNITNVQNNLSAFKKSLKTGLVAIGNSYLQGGIFELIKNDYDYAIKATADGAGFAQYAEHPTTYRELFANIIPSIPDKTIITDVLFLCAWGDTRALTNGTQAYQTTLNSELASIYNLAKTTFPNLKNIYVAYAEARNFTNQSSPNTPMWAYYRAHQIFKETCYKHHVNYLGAVGWELMNTNNFLTDGYHPNSVGNNWILCKLRQRMHGYDSDTALNFFSTNLQFLQDGETKTGGELEIQMTPEKTEFFFNPHTSGTFTSLSLILSDSNPTFIKIAPLITSGMFDTFWIGDKRCSVQGIVSNYTIKFSFNDAITLTNNFVYHGSMVLFRTA